ncbi:MAG: RNase adapter RapZ [Alphaproteobacteria bacterium]
MITTPPKATAFNDAPKQRVIIVTGLSGAGKSSALKALEDMAYEAVDNLPLTLLGTVVTPRPDRARDGAHKPLVIGVDIRTRDFAVGSFLNELDQLMGRDEISVRLLFLDCSDEVLRRRYTETRRRHPLAGDRPVSDGIQHERRLLAGLRDRADDTIDTSELSPGELRQILKGHFALDTPAGLTVFVTSFSYRHGLPREADLVFDVRFLRNPHYEPDLRPLSGLDAAVGAFIAADSGCAGFILDITGLLSNMLPRFEQEGKSYLTIALGCTGGRHRSVYMAEQLAAWLRDRGLTVGVNHRDMGQ